MIQFNCDYLEGAHPKILEALLQTNLEQCPGYGQDSHCENAARLILDKCGDQSCAVHLLIGGTGANTTVIAAALRPYEGVLSADSGHINTHETGAIESSGHKVLALPGKDGKLSAEMVESAVLQQADNEHTVKPGMVYISHPTEYGTLYSLDELVLLYEVCRRFSLPLYIDGARLGYGLMSPETDVTLQDICRLSDVFTIGATKVGALFGEAVVIKQPALQTRFRYMIKQRGGMLAKGRLLGVQFETLMADGLYESIAAHAISLAQEIRAALKSQRIPLLIDSPTNQLFPVLEDTVLERLSQQFTFGFWEKAGQNHTAVRICTSWATTREQADALINAIMLL